ncbi:MAG: galactosyltransferase-related protein [Ferruginibacter sp.]
MKYLSAQPDDYYFLWQLQLQLFNFSKLGISSKDIHVLIGYNAKKGLSKEFETFFCQNKQASIFLYPDERKSRFYLSSLRPHIIAKHFRKHPELENQIIFYHDSDIVFNSLPDFDNLIKDDIWYVSDTRSYLDCDYIKRTAGEKVFHKMCDVVGIEPVIVENNNDNAGGAQYLLKECKTSFWQKLEKDCEGLYKLLEDYNDLAGFCNKKTNPKGIQAWCADMWAVLWNAWYFNYKVRIHKELDFCWPYDPIDHWKQKKILHYSGILSKDDKSVFNKSIYLKYDPFYDNNINKINKKTCSFPLVQLIKEKRYELDKNRIHLTDVTFLIPVRIDSESRLKNLNVIIQYLDKYFDTRIIIIESAIKPQIDSKSLPLNCSYIFEKDGNNLLHRTKINNKLICRAETKIIVLYDADVIIPVNQILEATALLRRNVADMVYPYDGTFVKIDSLCKEMFLKIIDDKLLKLNQNKFIIGTKRSFGGAVFINRRNYVNAGMENENFESWGPEDAERRKRMQILGYKIKRIDGLLFHLPHERFLNSFYKDNDCRIAYMEEYIKVCSMEKRQLQSYINTWAWTR